MSSRVNACCALPRSPKNAKKPFMSRTYESTVLRDSPLSIERYDMKELSTSTDLFISPTFFEARKDFHLVIHYSSNFEEMLRVFHVIYQEPLHRFGAAPLGLLPQLYGVVAVHAPDALLAFDAEYLLQFLEPPIHLQPASGEAEIEMRNIEFYSRKRPDKKWHIESCSVKGNQIFIA